LSPIGGVPLTPATIARPATALAKRQVPSRAKHLGQQTSYRYIGLGVAVSGLVVALRVRIPQGEVGLIVPAASAQIPASVDTGAQYRCEDVSGLHVGGGLSFELRDPSARARVHKPERPARPLPRT
jgi:hypothetical protein